MGYSDVMPGGRSDWRRGRTGLGRVWRKWITRITYAYELRVPSITRLVRARVRVRVRMSEGADEGESEEE